jgi:SAM-dependent methyltransferase
MIRDTDRDWQHYGASEPFYGVLTHDKFLRENLTDQSLQEFWQSGREDMGRIWGELVHSFGERSPEIALDFGCGVGRLTRAMAEIARRAVGVDVSPDMIAEGLSHAPPNVELTDKLPDGPFDWINSYIVFQHVPPERGYALLEELLQRAADKCLLSVHFTLFKDARGLSDHGIDAIEFGTVDAGTIRPLIRKDRVHRMMMYDYDLTRIFAMLVAHRFTQVRLSHTDHAGAHGAVILAAR